jgi:hypothetical protein
MAPSRRARLASVATLATVLIYCAAVGQQHSGVRVGRTASQQAPAAAADTVRPHDNAMHRRPAQNRAASPRRVTGRFGASSAHGAENWTRPRHHSTASGETAVRGGGGWALAGTPSSRATRTGQSESGQRPRPSAVVAASNALPGLRSRAQPTFQRTAVANSRDVAAVAGAGDASRRPASRGAKPPAAARASATTPGVLEVYARTHWASGEADLARFSQSSGRRALVVVFREYPWGAPRGGPGQIPDGGISDRLTGIVTHFVAALATNATFLLDWPAFELYYRPRYGFTIKDTEKQVAPELVQPPRLQQFRFQRFRGHLVLSSASTQSVTVCRAGFGALNCFWNVGPPQRPQCTALRQAVAKLQPSGVRSLTTSVHFEDAFREIFDFLFEPTALLTSVLPVAPRIVAKVPAGHKVLLQIRTGDTTIQQQGKGLHTGEKQKADRFFNCVLKHFPLASMSLWFVMTDSEVVKDYAMEKYPKLAVVNSQGKIADSTKGYTTADGKDHTKDPLLHVLAEQWLATHCDVFIVTKNSGLGRQAAFRSVHPQRTLLYGDTCQQVSWDKAALDWSNI